MSDKKALFRDKLISAISETMENMTFEDVLFLNDEAAANSLHGNNKFWAMMPILKPFHARLVLEVPQEYGKVLANEVYGEVDSEPSEESVQDIVAEMLNTISGSFISSVVPANETMRLGLPEKGRGNPPTVYDKSISVFLNIGDYYLSVSFAGSDILD